MAKYPHVNAANKYARDVVAGKIVVGKFVRLACQRHFDDLAHSKKRDPKFPYVFDKELATRPCLFIELLPHVKGKWAGAKELIVLEPWQCFILCMIFGWVHRKTKKRRFRQAYIKVPRKNGKSVFGAGIGLFMMCADFEYGAEVYCGATTEKQAWEVFRPARKQCLKTPDLVERYEVEVKAKALWIDEDDSRFEPVIGDPPDGSSPHCFAIDEFHEHPTSAMFDTAETGMLAREQPLILVITTAGFNITGPCYQYEMDANNVLDGLVQDDELFAIMYGLDKGDDWTDPAMLRKANPNFGISINPDILEKSHAKAVQLAHKANAFKTKHLNVWVAAASAFFNMQHWSAAKNLTLTVEDVAHLPAWYCLDLASKIDICAFVRVFLRHEDGQRHYYFFGRYYVPYDTAHDLDNPNYDLYQDWAKKGYLEITGDAEIDFNQIEADVIELAQGINVREIPHDTWNALQMAKSMAEKGHVTIAVPQDTFNLSPGMKELEAALKAGRVHHDGNPVLTWMFGNVTAREDWNGNYFPRKEQKGSPRKIDGAVCSIMGVGRAMHDEGPPSLDDYIDEPLEIDF